MTRSFPIVGHHPFWVREQACALARRGLSAGVSCPLWLTPDFGVAAAERNGTIDLEELAVCLWRRT